MKQKNWIYYLITLSLPFLRCSILYQSMVSTHIVTLITNIYQYLDKQYDYHYALLQLGQSTTTSTHVYTPLAK